MNVPAASSTGRGSRGTAPRAGGAVEPAEAAGAAVGTVAVSVGGAVVSSDGAVTVSEGTAVVVAGAAVEAGAPADDVPAPRTVARAVVAVLGAAAPRALPASSGEPQATRIATNAPSTIAAATTNAWR